MEVTARLATPGDVPEVVRLRRVLFQSLGETGDGWQPACADVLTRALYDHSMIVAVVDAFDAMTTNRAYRPPRSATEAMDELRACARTHFDAEVVSAFERVFGDLPVLPLPT